ncbi:MAG: DUF2752 domain-containing protein [Oscillospiraceae bacterium]|nr:DUF2752 domain-containing protein [Oscillospiraceae bacterium]
MKARIQAFRREHGDLLRLLRGFLIFGGAYCLFTLLTGWGIPCIFHAVTGLCCPGCGISRFFLCLLRLDVSGALRQNLAVGVLLPLWLGVAAVEFFWNPKALEKGSILNRILLPGSIVFLLLFGILRNLPGFSFLLPT